MKLPPFALLLAALCLACWPVLRWFVAGTLDGSNDCAGLLAAAAAAIIVLAPAREALARPLVLPCACLAVYLAATACQVPAPARSPLLALAITALASSLRLGKRFDVALFTLCILALPLSATLQFYLGYPLRVLAGDLSAFLLRMNGIAVAREGAMLAWQGQLVSIDAPCSGVKMLWAGLLLAGALAGAVRLSSLRTAVALMLAIAAVVAANAIRAAALFYMEAGIVHLPASAHEAIGVVSFAAAGAGILFMTHRMERRAA
ncbi:exosortase/archaeosortase family protein [Duganella sp. CF458]|uniref:archaeosortase/exosortase family protein n=1 Tax=Duganella sp. CF458 TaxID=1884368 RepID=UPI0008EB0299|nr:archaeosortase/exosortase family protein [Duganella sp. CF458]SFF51502.1 exosortase/archaeosortase family protein [Duganella sp. CF458]